MEVFHILTELSGHTLALESQRPHQNSNGKNTPKRHIDILTVARAVIWSDSSFLRIFFGGLVTRGPWDFNSHNGLVEMHVLTYFSEVHALWGHNYSGFCVFIYLWGPFLLVLGFSRGPFVAGPRKFTHTIRSSGCTFWYIRRMACMWSAAVILLLLKSPLQQIWM